MHPLEARIRARSAELAAARAELRRHRRALQAGLSREIRSPKALAAALGAGLIVGSLRCRGGKAAEPGAPAAVGPTLRWLLRDVAVPLTLGLISARDHGDG